MPHWREKLRPRSHFDLVTTAWESTIQVLMDIEVYEVQFPRPDPPDIKVFVYDWVTCNPWHDLSLGYRFNRPYKWYATWIRQIISKVDLLIKDDTKMWWKQTLGDPHGSMPGFIFKGTKHFESREYVIKILGTKVYNPTRDGDERIRFKEGDFTYSWEGDDEEN